MSMPAAAGIISGVIGSASHQASGNESTEHAGPSFRCSVRCVFAQPGEPACELFDGRRQFAALYGDRSAAVERLDGGSIVAWEGKCELLADRMFHVILSDLCLFVVAIQHHLN